MSVTELTEHQERSEKEVISSAAPYVVLVPLILGVLTTAAGIGLMISALGLAFFAIGLVLLAVSSVAARRASVFLMPEESMALALYVAVEFLSGAFLGVIGIGNIAFGFDSLDLNLAALAAFGLLLIIDSLLIYRKGFAKND